MKTEHNHAIENGRGWLETMKEIANGLKSRDEQDRDNARERAFESPLSIQVRSGWHDLGEPSEDKEFNVLLSTGGPALRIVGNLDGGEPSNARLEWQDWGTPWTPMDLDEADQAALDAFVGCFYFGY